MQTLRLCAYAALFAIASSNAFAADHRDGPLATGDPAADLNDVYTFMNPTDPNELIIVSTVVPFANFNSRFSDAVEYRVHVDNGAAGGAVTINCRFTDQSNRINCTAPNGLAAAGGVERILTGTGMRVWAGLRDDPFFFDLDKFNQTRLTLVPAFTNPGTNTFTGNTLAIVFGIDKTRLTNNGANSTLKVWSSTNRLGENGISAGFTGLWYDAAQPGFGAHLEVLEPATPGGPDRFITTWYVYNGTGQQRWILGIGNINGNTVTIPDAIYTSGGRMPPNFQSNQVTNRPFGSLTFTFSSCNSGTLSYTTNDADFGSTSGTVSLSRLTAIKGLPCSLLSLGQIDRNGRPGINSVAINVLPNTGTALKDAYNRAGDPSTWAGLFRNEIQSNLAALDTLDGITGNAVLPAAALAGVLVDDRLIINTAIPVCDAYLAVELGVAQCGGRTLARDVIDDSLGAIVGPGVRDNVANDSAFLQTFPFMGPPI